MCGTFSFSVVAVMMIAPTPSLKDSSRPVPMPAAFPCCG
jgi:hypothetical protein